ncbi:TauD/TfdA family dioxygenase [Pseudovibrio sp. SPO723]|uniref:TauD/TfdA family dioxygenase n=1 Tax=Nesiotobacter zosterae TaxID=392721 RepID=UPI0029C5F4F0|nr:TauD/TfdA family dioxygenase [Pseudovibrio sp. SPO723]MDX5593461.1 TauD/TfdA family dioxygenase [Pseudovibrio sp. SPO723]
MELVCVDKDLGAVRLRDHLGTDLSYPFIWLRDNCPSAYHPDTKERTFDLLSVEMDREPEAVRTDGDTLIVEWPDHTSQFSMNWLSEHRPGVPVADPADLPAVPWRGDLGSSNIPRAKAQDVLHDDGALKDWLEATRRYGLSIVEGLEDDPEAGMAVARRVGFLRETNFGTTFQVKSKPNPNNLAYTADALPLHTDLPNQELPPGFQFLHCLANAAEGGGSIFADGVAISEDLCREDPEAFHLLSTVSIPFRFHDEAYDIRRRQFVITTREDGQVSEVCYNAHIAGTFDLPAEQMRGYYRAYRAFMAKTRDPRYVLSLTLSGGQMVVFDNRRVLHGREAFDPNTGRRHLHGCYVDRGEFESRLRVLARR